MVAANPDDRTSDNPTPNPPRHGPILARMIDGNCLTLVGDAVSELPAAEWFEVSCADGKIVLSPIPSPPTAGDLTPPAERAKRPYAHLTLEQLRELEHITSEEWFEELRARDIIKGKPKGVGVLNIKPVGRVPGALDRFLKERAAEG